MGKKILVFILSCSSLLAYLPFELRTSYGETLHRLSKTDLNETIKDYSVSAGIGTKPWYNFDLFFHLNYSNYSASGNGYAVTPIANLTYNAKPGFPGSFNPLRIYGGFGAGLGYDTMRINRYTNKWKWTLDGFMGVQYYFTQHNSLKVGALVRHKSHSMVGPWQGRGNNVGYNGLMFDFFYKTRLPL